MILIEELFETDLEAASKMACSVVPDVVAALDLLMPRLVSSGDRATLRRYSIFVNAAAEALTALPARHPEALPPASVVYELLRRGTAEVPWVTPSGDGLGVVTVLVDRLRGLAGGLRPQCVGTRHDIDVHRFSWFLKSMAEIEHEQASASPLRRAMTTLELSSSEMADLMGVKRQAVDKWLLAGPPEDRMQKIGAVAEIADLLRYRLRDGMPAVVARRNAEAYGGRSMLDMIADDEQEWLRQSVKESFDFTRVA
jgi:hypothetical protein